MPSQAILFRSTLPTAHPHKPLRALHRAATSILDSSEALPMFEDGKSPRPTAHLGLMVPLQEMEHQHAQRAFELVVLLLAHVVDLLGDGGGVNFGKPTG